MSGDDSPDARANVEPAADLSVELPRLRNEVPEAELAKRRSRGERAGIGGSKNHGPLCQCNPCAARRRKQEALALAAGAGGMRLAPQFLPQKPVVDKNGQRRATPRSLKHRVAQYLQTSMALPDATKSDIAAHMGITTAQLYSVMTRGKAAGLLTFTDPFDVIDFELIPKVVDNLNYFLDKRDRTVTIEAAKGTLFRTYQESKGVSEAPQVALALKIEMPSSPTGSPGVLTGHIVGKGRNADTVSSVISSHEEDNDEASTFP